MQHNYLKSSLLFLLSLCCLCLSFGCSGTTPRAQQGAHHPSVGQPLISLELEPLTGNSETITKDSLQGRVTLINFWATWCPPCKLEFPHLAAVAKKLSSESKFQFISVNTDEETIENARELAQKFLLEQGVSHATWVDSTRGTWSGVARQFGATGIPLTIILDPQGIVRGIWNGYHRGDELAMEALVRELLKNN